MLNVHDDGRVECDTWRTIESKRKNIYKLLIMNRAVGTNALRNFYCTKTEITNKILKLINHKHKTCFCLTGRANIFLFQLFRLKTTTHIFDFYNKDNEIIMNVRFEQHRKCHANKAKRPTIVKWEMDYKWYFLPRIGILEYLNQTVLIPKNLW